MSAICGIVGAGAGEQKGARDLAIMLELLKSRGPDGVARHVTPAGAAAGQPPLALGFRLLRVVPTDPPPAVARTEDGASFAVADGRIFNADQVRDYLKGRGRATRTADAGELLLQIYDVDGIDGFRRLDGQFAAAIWDGRKNTLVLARDFLGVRPVYFHVGRGGIVFASEIKALLGVPEVPVAVDEVAVSHYLTFLTVPGPRTLFQGVQKVPAGAAVFYGADGTVTTKPFWDLLWDPVPEVDDEQFYVKRVRELHEGAVRRRFVPGPIAALVSGGNDSSANAALLARQVAKPDDLHTFTVGLAEFEGDEKYSDLKYARQVAELIKSQHHEKLMNVDEFLDTIPIAADAMDDLVSEPSSVFLYQALKMAKDQGLKVVVTGEANDELSCGHGEMIRIRARYYERWLPFLKLPGIVRKLAAAAAPIVARKRVDLLRRAASGEEFFWNFEIGWPESERDAIMSPQAMRATAGEPPGGVVARDAARLKDSAHGNRDYLNHIIYRMMQDYYFGNLMLGKLDLLSSHLGLESRCPYTEPAYAHFVYNIPAKFKQKDGMVKYFFKKAIEGILPDSIIYRPKQGFRTPVVELFRGRLGEWGKSYLLDDGLTKTGFLRRDQIATLLQNHRTGVGDFSNRLWTVMVLNLWHRRWIQSGRPAAATTSSPAPAPRAEA
ncbi:MAG TPA: asparagine synthase (glutamine-hydrolyzing) [Polyangia bacterium]|nr:asparagine synthase (glutamine-hydrolyzing) [Polyangia bacterium]